MEIWPAAKYKTNAYWKAAFATEIIPLLLSPNPLKRDFCFANLYVHGMLFSLSEVPHPCTHKRMDRHSGYLRSHNKWQETREIGGKVNVCCPDDSVTKPSTKSNGTTTTMARGTMASWPRTFLVEDAWSKNTNSTTKHMAPNLCVFSVALRNSAKMKLWLGPTD